MADSISSGGVLFPSLYNESAATVPLNMQNSASFTGSAGYAFVGRVALENATPSALLSSAGGKIMFRTGGVSIWQALSTLAVGIQDVGTAAPGVPDGVFDVSTSITSSTVTLTSNFWHTFNMTAGAKTLSHGQLYAVVARLTKVSTDAASIGYIQGSMTSPAVFSLSVATYTAINGVPNCMLQCDDGTLGWFQGSFALSSISSQSISAGSTNNEVGLRFALPWTAQVDMFGVQYAGPAGGATQVILYSDPKGTPVTVTAVDLPASNLPIVSTQVLVPVPLREPVTITASTTYVLALKSASTSAVTARLMQFDNAAYKISVPGGGGCAKAVRGGGAGAFSMVETAIPAGFYVRTHQILSSATTVTATTTITVTVGGGAGGILVHPGMTGGVNG